MNGKIDNLADIEYSEEMQYLYGLSEADYIESIVVMPDFHWKDGMFVPSSISIRTKDVFVPQFTSSAVNCGMSLIDTGVKRDEVNIGRLQRTFERININSASSKLQKNRYSLTKEELIKACKLGAYSTAKKYNINLEVLMSIENGGCIQVEPDEKQIEEIIPGIIKNTGVAQNEIGLNFGGNHFLEFQLIDRVLDEDQLKKMNLDPNDLYCLYHTGPGPLVANLLRFYTYDNKMNHSNKPIFFMMKLLFHLGRIREQWDLVFKKGIRPVIFDSMYGSKLMQIYNMGMNYGYAYRLTTYEALKEALENEFNKDLRVRVIWDVSHNSITRNQEGEKNFFYHRHNCCAVIPKKPVIISGYNNVNSLIGIGLDSNNKLASYDHGFGNLIKENGNEVKAVCENQFTYCMKYKRGAETKIVKSCVKPHADSDIMLKNAKVLEDRGLIHPVAFLRPIANFKN